MADQNRCPQCRQPIPADAPADGLCPRCLMKQGLESQSFTRTGPGPGHRFEAPPPERLAPRFPELEILELIGQGGMGAVYKARQTRLDRIVALKILSTETARGPAFAERFIREARALARVSHPNIVAIHDFGEKDGLYYFLMEFVDGANLRDVLRAGTLSPPEALAIVPQVCDALQYAHEEGVVHRDIKPENILLDGKGRVKIADFGLAKLFEPERRDVTLTVPGEVLGTPAYMAPEQIEKPLEVDHRADIYSLGVVFYEMLTGELPLGRFDPPSRKVRVDVRLDEVVLRTLDKEPGRRYQHADDVKSDVQAIGAVPAEEARPAQPPPAEPEGHRGEGAEASFSSPAEVPPGTGSRTVEIRRPTGVTWVAIYCFGMVLLGVPFLALTRGIGAELPWSHSTSILSWPLGGWTGTYLGFLGRPVLMTALGWCVAIWAVVVGIGLLRLRRWARLHAIVLACVGLFCCFPVGLVLSILVLAYLLRRDVRRIFELGEGPATLDEAEARTLERAMDDRARA